METKTRFSIFKRALERDIEWVRVGFVVILFALVGTAFFGVTVPFYNDSARDVKGALLEKDSIIEKAIYKMPFTGKEAEQIKEQYEISREIKDSYMMIAFHYTVYNYAFSIFFTVFSVITGLLGFLLVKKGWDNTKNFYLRAAFLVSFFLSHSYNIFQFNSENITLTPISFVEQPWVLPGSAKNVMEVLDIPKSLNQQCFYFSETTTQEPRMLTGWLRCLYSMENSRCQQSSKVNIQFGLFQNILDISRFLAAFHKAWKVSRQPGELPEHLESFNTIKNIFNNHRKWRERLNTSRKSGRFPNRLGIFRTS